MRHADRSHPQANTNACRPVDPRGAIGSAVTDISEKRGFYTSFHRAKAKDACFYTPFVFDYEIPTVIGKNSCPFMLPVCNDPVARFEGDHNEQFQKALSIDQPS